ncbi:hypothetical protein PIB30_069185 [Stylosanthes scabra]|uniref:Uncharacterized protein n=1 Tax=Stylosanthes scabra TaxID=79078 RepID=A0ABU6WLF4_9FABA|nr:hypothetical protein [Stylosanthes scabra]
MEALGYIKMMMGTIDALRVFIGGRIEPHSSPSPPKQRGTLASKLITYSSRRQGPPPSHRLDLQCLFVTQGAPPTAISTASSPQLASLPASAPTTATPPSASPTASATESPPAPPTSPSEAPGSASVPTSAGGPSVGVPPVDATGSSPPKNGAPLRTVSLAGFVVGAAVTMLPICLQQLLSEVQT